MIREEKFVHEYVRDGKRVARDHKGRAYPSVAAMCRAWGVPKQEYVWRMHQGWGVEASLTLGGPAPRGGCPSRFRQSRRRSAIRAPRGR